MVVWVTLSTTHTVVGAGGCAPVGIEQYSHTSVVTDDARAPTRSNSSSLSSRITVDKNF